MILRPFISQVMPVGALMISLAFLLFAGGMNSLIIPVRGASEGFTAVSIGLIGTGWAFGHMAGCMLTSRLVSNVGHSRAFSVMAALAAVAVLLSLILISPYAWIPLRALSGFCFAGAAMIAESWLNERTETATRGRIFALYTMVSLGATVGGQMTLTLGNTGTYLFFVLAAIFYCLAVVPTAASSSANPKPLVRVRLDIVSQWKNSPIAVLAVLVAGISNAAFGTLAAVYGSRMGLTLATIALFASVPILAGALAQVPVGYASDRMDRRWVLVAVAITAMAAGAGFILFEPDGRGMNLFLVSVFGAAIYSMYPVIVAHASDHAPPDTYIQTSGGLLLVYGLGATVGPLLGGSAMYVIGPQGLFVTTLTAHAVLVAFALWRIRVRDAVSNEEKVEFQSSPPARVLTPETAVLAAEKSTSVSK